MTGNYGTVQTKGDGAGGYEGYSINGRYVFMSANDGSCGIFNDLDNQWMVFCTRNSSVVLYFNGATTLITTSSGITVYGSVNPTSDDRLKHNEVVITSALDVIRKLSPQKYDKTLEMKAEDINGEIEGDYNVEAGLIAQELLEIPELAFVVSGGGDITDTDLSGVETTKPQPYAVNYNSIFTYNVAATKELDAIVASQAELLRLERLKTAALESQMTNILNRLTALEN